MRLPPLLKGKSSEIRGSLWYKFLGCLIGGVLWLLGSTWKYRFTFKCGRSNVLRSGIIMVWHNRIFVTPSAWLQLGSDQPMSFLTSASKDGTLVNEALKVFGLEGVRGSSSRRGVAAMVKMRRMLQQGYSFTMTPDGPKGPIYRIKEGALKLAQIAQCPVIPISVQMNDTWRLKTWDGMCLPKPFSTIDICFNEEVFIPEDLTEEEFYKYATNIEKTMGVGLPDFPEMTKENT